MVKQESFSRRSQYLIISIVPSAGCIWPQVQTRSRYSSSRVDISLAFEMQGASRRNLRSAYGARVGRNACIRCNERTREGRQLWEPLAFHAVSFQHGKNRSIRRERETHCQYSFTSLKSTSYLIIVTALPSESLFTLIFVAMHAIWT